MRHRPSHIARFLSLFLTAVLLLVAVGGSSWTAASPAAARTVDAGHQPGKKANNGTEAVVQAASFEAVVTPAVTFGFQQAVYLLPPPVTFFMTGEPVLAGHFEIPYFYFSYFRHIFGHHIATNAP
ncbi:hypothetical protein [Larkinella soli]|uniref:hypothetical protein n=1 Tax=Larkinella soli TaxID=1770527 RepID=UPI000FFC62F4|nr:hypothetical protein [Larkinella soli]